MLLFTLLSAGIATAQEEDPEEPVRHPSVPEYDVTRPVRIKDIVTVEGVRSNFLKGFGLVIGLSGTGDSPKTVQRLMMSRVLRNMKFRVNPADVESKNIAIVIVTAELPPFCKAGTRFDVTVSSYGDARSLRGGILLETPLQGPGAMDEDTPEMDQYFALAQGPLTLGPEGSHPTTATIPNGAILEQEVPTDFISGDTVRLILKRPDFSHAREIAMTINASAGEFMETLAMRLLNIARPESASVVTVTIPEEFQMNNFAGRTPVDFIAKVLDLEIDNLSPTEAMVVIDEKTMTVGIHGHVTVSPAVVITRNVRLHIPERPEPGAEGTALGTYSLKDIIGRMDAAGVDAATIIEVVKSLHAQGALRAVLVVK